MSDGRRVRLGIGVVGFGWLGQAHARSLLRIPSLFEPRNYEVRLIAVADPLAARRARAVADWGFRRASADPQDVIDDPEVDAVWITAPNMVHVELVEATARSGKPVFCEKPVGGRPEDVVAAVGAVRAAGVVSGVGYNYRWAPLVQHAKTMIAAGELGELTNYHGRFFSMYGADPQGVNSWRFQMAEGGFGVSSDLLSHAGDLALHLAGPISAVVGTVHTFITERPEPAAGGSHYGRAEAEAPRRPVTNEDYAAMLVRFTSGAVGTFESSRTIVGPESAMAFDVHGSAGALSWNLEQLNELRHYRRPADRFGSDPLSPGALNTGYTTVLGGDRFPHHGAFVPGAGNAIGFEDLVAIEDHEFCAALAADRSFTPSLEAALAWSEVQAALLRSVDSGHWEDVVPLDPTPGVRAPTHPGPEGAPR